ncbi:MAG: type II secretion system protein GspG [Planctomycetaceae bacterium]|jgi:type II secretion system protein G|nr:type II secretion system protein GspG [Planctomycetaceae bacterium]
MSKNQFRNAFTLLELIAVLVILVALTALLATSVFERIKRANISATKVQIGNFTQSLERYQLDHGSFPTTEQGLNALIYIPSNELQAVTGGAVPMNNGMMSSTPGANMGATSLSTDSLGNAMMSGAIDPATGAPMGGVVPSAGPDTMPMTGGAMPTNGMPMTGDPMMMGGAMPAGAIDPMTGMPVSGTTGTGMTGMSNWTQSTFNPQLYVNARMRPEPYFESNEGKIPNDQWGMPYHYEYSLVNGINPRTGKNSPAIWSSGPDKTDNTDDDIRNFDPVQVADQLKLTPNTMNPMQPNPMGMDGGMIDPATGMPNPAMPTPGGYPTTPTPGGYPTTPTPGGYPTTPPATGFPPTQPTPDGGFPAQPPMTVPGT